MVIDYDVLFVKVKIVHPAIEIVNEEVGVFDGLNILYIFFVFLNVFLFFTTR